MYFQAKMRSLPWWVIPAMTSKTPSCSIEQHWTEDTAAASSIETLKPQWNDIQIRWNGVFTFYGYTCLLKTKTHYLIVVGWYINCKTISRLTDNFFRFLSVNLVSKLNVLYFQLMIKRLDRSFKSVTTKCSIFIFLFQSTDRILGPLVDAATKKPIWRHDILDLDGIAQPGLKCENKQVITSF